MSEPARLPYLYKNWTVKVCTEADEYVASYRWHVLRASSKAEIESLIDADDGDITSGSF